MQLFYKVGQPYYTYNYHKFNWRRSNVESDENNAGYIELL